MFGMQIVVWTIRVMCVLAELESLARRRGHREKQGSVVDKE